MEHKPVSADDILKVTNYMLFAHQGFIKAVPRKQIAEALGLDDRYFRDVCAEIPEIITSEKYGYYILPLTDPTGLEARRAREIINGEDRHRMISLYLRMRRRRQAITRMLDRERQLQFA